MWSRANTTVGNHRNNGLLNSKLWGHSREYCNSSTAPAKHNNVMIHELDPWSVLTDD